MSESKFQSIETQEAFDKAVKDRLAREREKFSDYEELKAKNAELESDKVALQTSIDELTNDLQDKNEEISGLNSQITSHSLENMRTKIAIENGIPLEMASRLVGDDEDEIRADAEKIAGFINSKQPPAPLKNVEPNIPTNDVDRAYQQFTEGLDLEGE